MKQIKRFAAVILALVMVSSLVACSPEAKPSSSSMDDKPTSTSTSTPAPTPETPQAVVDPEELEWGYEESGSSDTQHWYVDGNKSKSDYIFFEDIYLYIVKNGETESVHTDFKDKHIIDTDTEGKGYDFVFTDIFTCYDLVSGKCYKRSDYKAVVDSLCASDFICDTDNAWTLTFNSDGTMSYNHENEPKNGTWWITDAQTVSYRFDSESEGGGWFVISYNDADWTIASLKDMDVFYPAK